jgi:hypothetical protein
LICFEMRLEPSLRCNSSSSYKFIIANSFLAAGLSILNYGICFTLFPAINPPKMTRNAAEKLLVIDRLLSRINIAER